ncbi:MAG: UPF0262 family protein [Alphaproteobacteria bacterium]|nr:UPF0262 family protein [Alphaproteobacteria bacterium]
MMSAGEAARIVHIRLDQPDSPRLSPEAEHERSIAIYDLIEQNSFSLPDAEGPYHLILRSDMRHIHFDIRSVDDLPIAGFFLAMGPLRRIIRDYKMVCDSYYDAIRTKTPSQIQSIDMGRRSLHNEGSVLLRERLEGKVIMDDNTSRRLFSLICVLKSRGVT